MKLATNLAAVLLCAAAFFNCADGADLTLTHVGTFRTPAFGKNLVAQDIYNNDYQAICPGPQPNQLYISWRHTKALQGTSAPTYKNSVGIMQIPATLGLPGSPVINAPKATWTKQPVFVGKEFTDLVVASGSGANWAELRGIAKSDEKLLLNYGQYYAVAPRYYPNLGSISLDLDPATETPLVNTDPQRNARDHGGWIKPAPQDWKPGNYFVRGGFWGNGPGPRTELIDASHNPLTFQIAAEYPFDASRPPGWPANHPVDNTYTLYDEWFGSLFIDRIVPPVSPATQPTTEHFIAACLRKGQDVNHGWYGGSTSPTGVYDSCNPSQGAHGFPYRPEVWLFRRQDFDSVLNGSVPKWFPAPIQKLALTGWSPCCRMADNCLVGDKLYVIEISACQWTTNSYGWSNAVHVYQVGWK